MASAVKECNVEDYYVSAVKAAGGGTRPIAYRGRRGAADHLTLFPFNRIFLVELKRPKGGKIRMQQWEDAKWLQTFGVQKEFIHTFAAVDAFIARVVRGRQYEPACEPACICDKCLPF